MGNRRLVYKVEVVSDFTSWNTTTSINIVVMQQLSQYCIKIHEKLIGLQAKTKEQIATFRKPVIDEVFLHNRVPQ